MKHLNSLNGNLKICIINVKKKKKETQQGCVYYVRN